MLIAAEKKLILLLIALLLTNCASENVESPDVPDLTLKEISVLEKRASSGDIKAIDRLTLDAIAKNRFEDAKRYSVLGAFFGDCKSVDALEEIKSVYKYKDISQDEIDSLKGSSKCK